MAFKVITFTKRKAGVTPQQYKEELESKHVPVFREIAGDAFPLSHTRQYLSLDEAGNPVALLGDASVATFDAMAVAIYEDRAHFERLISILREPANLKRLREDGGDVVDGTQTFMVEVGEVCETKR